MFKIISDKNRFDHFKPILSDNVIVEHFKRGPIFNKLLSVLEEAHIINNGIKKLYFAIGNSYLNKGFKGILKFQIDNEKDTDKAYLKAFRNMRDIVEYEIPRALSLFESIFAYVAELKEYSTAELGLSKVISYFETGVKSPFGSSLMEYGFPVDTVRKIELKFSDLIRMDAMEGKEYYRRNESEINELLDDYEKQLIDEAIFRIR